MPSRSTSLWLFCLFVACVLAGFDLSTEHAPSGPLGVALDYNFALNTGRKTTTQAGSRDKRAMVYSSHLTFSASVSAISDAQVVQMTIDAYNEMDAEHTKYGFDRLSLPTVMHSLTIGREIYLTSSIKGAHNFIYELSDSPVKLALQRCQLAWHEQGGSNTQHVSRGGCGEMMGAHQFYQSHPDRASMQNLGARSYSVAFDRGQKRVMYKAPCGTDARDETWGCNVFLQDQGWTLIAEQNGASYDLKVLAGGCRLDQIPTC